jgi:hypothetical protein
MKVADIFEIVSAITYKPGWVVQLGCDSDARPYLQVVVDETAEAAIDSTAADRRTPWRSAKRFISLHMCRQEIVGAAFGAIRDAEEHEMREWFRYRGAAIFNPHLDPDVLAEVAQRASSFNFRVNAMTMEEP